MVTYSYIVLALFSVCVIDSLIFWNSKSFMAWCCAWGWCFAYILKGT